MTAPARPRTSSRGGTSTRTGQRATAPAEAPSRTSPRPDRSPPAGTRKRSDAAERAYARRAQRATQLEHDEAEQPTRQRLLRLPGSRASFVLLLMALLAIGVATTLWLSTQAITDTYRLEELRGSNSRLTERAEQLRRAVTQQESPSALAERAKELGMVPGGTPAWLVVGEDGKVRVVGEPEAAEAPAPPPEPEPEPEPEAEQPRGDADDGQAQPNEQSEQNAANDPGTGDRRQEQDQQGEDQQSRQQGDHVAAQEERGGTGGE